MSNPMVVVVKLDGFQHGPDEFTPKCRAVACDALQLASHWLFQTEFLASRPKEYLSTYHYQSTFVHGLLLTGPGLPHGFNDNNNNNNNDNNNNNNNNNNLYFKRVTPITLKSILRSVPLKTKLIIINYNNHDKKPVYK